MRGGAGLQTFFLTKMDNWLSVTTLCRGKKVSTEIRGRGHLI